MNKSSRKNKQKRTSNAGTVWTESEKLTTFIWNRATTAASGIYTNYLIPNSVNNPLGPVAAIQPARYDQFIAMYNKYLVTDTAVKVTLNSVNIPTYPFVVAFYPIMGAYTAPATFQAAASLPGAVVRNWAPGSNSVVVRLAGKTSKMLGRPHNADDYGTLGGNPVTPMYFGIFIQLATALAVDITLLIEMDQVTKFSQRKTVIDV